MPQHFSSSLTGRWVDPTYGAPANSAPTYRPLRRGPLPSWGSRRILMALLLAVVLPAAACTTTRPPEPGRGDRLAYAHHVPPGITFDMALGQEVSPDAMAGRLARARMVFLGEHHTDARSHRFQAEILRRLIESGRPVRVALEMFPPEINPVLEAWRQGELNEQTFLVRSNWYRHWGFPWGYYRDLFALFREHRVPIYGVNATKDTRHAVRKNELDELTPEVRALVGDLNESLPPHEQYVFDTLAGTRHGGGFSSASPIFRRYVRGQRLWDRLMGIRTARLAAEQPANGVTVLLVGSGHLAYGLGANLWAAREVSGKEVMPTLTLWDTLVGDDELEPVLSHKESKAVDLNTVASKHHDDPLEGTYRVPLGMADWVRVYRRDNAEPELPALRGVKFVEEDGELRVDKLSASHGSPLKGLRKGDRILSFNGRELHRPVEGDLGLEVELRLAYEAIGEGGAIKDGATKDGVTKDGAIEEGAALLTVLREGKEVIVDITPAHNPHQH